MPQYFDVGNSLFLAKVNLIFTQIEPFFALSSKKIYKNLKNLTKKCDAQVVRNCNWSQPQSIFL